MLWTNEGVSAELSQRQLEVLELVAHGLSAKEIATQIGIAPRTVEGHIDTMRLKMRARNKAHIVTQAIQAGFLKVTPGLEDGTFILGRAEGD
jgi:DNA-binding CsgD family transcriptional regulator